jgi:hypothetical protein
VSPQQPPHHAHHHGHGHHHHKQHEHDASPSAAAGDRTLVAELLRVIEALRKENGDLRAEIMLLQAALASAS